MAFVTVLSIRLCRLFWNYLVPSLSLNSVLAGEGSPDGTGV